MFHDMFVKACSVLSQESRNSQSRRTVRRFQPQLGHDLLESRLSPSTLTVTPMGPSDQDYAPAPMTTPAPAPTQVVSVSYTAANDVDSMAV